MSIKKFICLLLFISMISAASRAQDEKIYNKLNGLYTLDKFEDCIKKSEDYIKGTKTSKDAYPYLYASMSYFSIYQNLERYDPKAFKDPLRKSLGFAGKYLKHDKRAELKTECADFLDQLRRAAIKECAYMRKNTDWRNLQNLAREMVKDYPKDDAMQIIAGSYLLFSSAKGEGEKAVNAGLDSLKKKPAITDTLLQGDYENAFFLYAEYLLEEKDIKKAKTMIKFALDYCPGNQALIDLADEINNFEPAAKPK